MKIDQQSRARKQAESSKGQHRPGNRSLTVAAQSEQSHAREQVDSTTGVRERRQNRSLTVAAQSEQSRAREQAASTQSTATPGLPAYPTGPRAYFITFSCYGAWLHGDAAGSVDRQHNVFTTPVVNPNAARQSFERGRMDQTDYELDAARRRQVLNAIQEVCSCRGWWLFAAHVRTTHVHVIVQAGDPPEKVMNDFKVYASRHLNETKLDGLGRKRWVRHGSTRYLWNREDLEGAIKYVLHEQGEPMAIYSGPGATQTEQCRAREQAESSKGQPRPNNRSLTVAAQSEQSRAREQAESVNGQHRPGNRSLTVAAQSAFTMMEIAISLAVIGIALVAIIGVLPIGMNVQQTNRQETIIGQDATVFMEAVRNGSLGLDDLTNYVYAISNYWTEFDTMNNGGKVLNTGVNGYTYSSCSIAPNYYTLYGTYITNGANIVGLMSTPEFTFNNGNVAAGVLYGGDIIYSNHVVVLCRSVSGPAIEKPPQDNQILQQDSFSYRIFCVNAPPAPDTNDYLSPNGPTMYDTEMLNALHELRLTFLWPQLPNGNLGSGRETFRTEVAGQLSHQPFGNPLGNPFSTVWNNTNFWCYFPESFTTNMSIP